VWTVRREAVLLALATTVMTAVAACSGSGPVPPPTHSPSPTPTPSPSPTAAPLTLTGYTYLGMRLDAPAHWRVARVRQTAIEGYLLLQHGTDAVEAQVSDCSACVDHGLVTTGRADGVPYPQGALTNYHVLATRPAGTARLRFTATAPYVGERIAGLVVVLRDAAGLISGYALVTVTAPPALARVAARILASFHPPPVYAGPPS
jgi:hypothetical protein